MLPTNCPVSYIDEFAETLCSITAVVDSPSIARAVSQTTHFVTVLRRETAEEEDGELALRGASELSASSPSSASTSSSSSSSSWASELVWGWAGLCGVGGSRRYALELSTQFPGGGGIEIYASPQCELSFPVTCRLPQCLAEG